MTLADTHPNKDRPMNSVSLAKTAHLCGTTGPTCPILSDANANADYMDALATLEELDAIDD